MSSASARRAAPPRCAGGRHRHPGRRAGDGRARRRALRQADDPGQQRLRLERDRQRRGRDRRGLGPGHGHRPQVDVPSGQAGRATPARRGRRCDGQHLVGARLAGGARRAGVRDDQSWRDRPVASAGGRVRPGWHSRERHLPRPHRDRTPRAALASRPERAALFRAAVSVAPHRQAGRDRERGRLSVFGRSRVRYWPGAGRGWRTVDSATGRPERPPGALRAGASRVGAGPAH